MRSTRREALKALGVTVGVAAFGRAEAVAHAGRAASRAGAPGPEGKPAAANGVSPLLGDLRGARLGACTVTDIGATEHGSIPVTFTDGQGSSFIVDVLRHDPVRPGVAQAGSLAVYMRVGRTPQVTNEEHGLAAMALAALLARREAEGAPIPALLTLTERAPVRTSWQHRHVARVA